MLEKKFSISSYPTYVFISPEGKLIDRATGMQSMDEFLEIMNKDNDPNRNFAGLVTQFEQGELAVDDWPKLDITAKVISKTD
jgi:hypothetical protein